ncbi:hypothetical protein C8J56DRAFT_1025522 [Mycena floridula]|nr:hypothetical protein C8J56DRAFT_1025522 [Mycena floridula]
MFNIDVQHCIVTMAAPITVQDIPSTATGDARTKGHMTTAGRGSVGIVEEAVAAELLRALGGDVWWYLPHDPLILINACIMWLQQSWNYYIDRTYATANLFHEYYTLTPSHQLTTERLGAVVVRGGVRSGGVGRGDVGMEMLGDCGNLSISGSTVDSCRVPRQEMWSIDFWASVQ